MPLRGSRAGAFCGQFNPVRLQNETAVTKIRFMPDGLMIIDKPRGFTSHDVVARLRRILKTKKIGHTGTLDPFATGVLVMLVGKATRLARFLHADEKEYLAVLRFGYETDTGDATGQKREGSEGDSVAAGLTVEALEEVLPYFTGKIEQIPPMYSAKKVEGKRLYKLARKGVEIERKPVTVEISELKLTGGPTRSEDTVEVGLRVVCSAGTYVRTLGEDIGKKIGTGCHLSELRRTRAGKFGLVLAETLESLEEKVQAGDGPAIIPMAEAVSHLPEHVLDENEAERIRNGIAVETTDDVFEGGEAVRLMGADGSLAAIGEYDTAAGVIRPKIVVI